jgi:hypothetical protein
MQLILAVLVPVAGAAGFLLAAALACSAREDDFRAGCRAGMRAASLALSTTASRTASSHAGERDDEP